MRWPQGGPRRFGWGFAALCLDRMSNSTPSRLQSRRPRPYVAEHEPLLSPLRSNSKPPAAATGTRLNADRVNSLRLFSAFDRTTAVPDRSPRDWPARRQRVCITSLGSGSPPKIQTGRTLWPPRRISTIPACSGPPLGCANAPASAQRLCRGDHDDAGNPEVQSVLRC